MNEILKSLHLQEHNMGASNGSWWSDTKTDGMVTSHNPATGEVLGSVYRANENDYEQLVKQAQLAQMQWRQVPAPKRGELIRAIGDELRQHKSLLGTLVSLEMGKSKQEGDGEVQEMIDMADLAVGQARMLYGNTMHSERNDHRMFEQWHPLGIVGVISAFNFPVAVWSWNAFLAVICGNVVIWKPSQKTALCAVAIQHICNRVMAKFGYEHIFSFFNSDNVSLLQHFVKDKRIDLISFTGSSSVGKEINLLVAERFGKVLLELSGNNAIILDEFADFNLAIPNIVFGAVGTAGQRCTTTRRLIIHESIYRQTLEKLVSAYKSITIGDPLIETNLLGPLIDKEAVLQYVNTIEEIKNQGGKILVGGRVINGPGNFVEPTIAEANNDWPIVQHETFAPILYVMPFTTLDEAIAMQNHSPFGLSSAIFTDNLQHAEQFLSARGSDCGIANVNIGTSGAEIGGAFGGEKATGGGREAGSDVWKSYMRRQTNTINYGKSVSLAQGIKFSV